MGKEKPGFLTPKAIANRVKAKGLQKLRWYCQMCQKQCRDENGFKCHTMSESHQRQLLLFAENPDKYLDYFSKDFFDGYLELLRRRFGTKRVNANMVYQEYISDRDHVHMNSTQWETLTDFIKWLGREGHCVVDQTEKGWFVCYIDRDPETIRRQEMIKSKEKMTLDDEEHIQKMINRQMERAEASSSHVTEQQATELKRDEDEEKVTFSLSSKASKPTLEPSALKLQAAEQPQSKDGKSLKHKSSKRKTALDDIMAEEEASKEKQKRTDNWIHTDIVVKIITKKLGDKYYKKKAVITEVRDQYTAIVKMLETGVTIKLDQTHLETVIPAIGRKVLVVNGAYREHTATLLSLNEKKFCCKIEIDRGPLKGRVVDAVAYEDISKLDSS